MSLPFEAISNLTSIKATGHKYDAGKVTGIATCTNNGAKLYTCSVCNGTKTETVKALGHNYKTSDTKKATCTQAGERTTTCSRCDYKKTETIKAKGHSWKNATCTAPKTCSTCKATEGKALGHTTTDGKCNRCSKTISIEDSLPKITIADALSKSHSISKLPQSSMTVDPAEILTYNGNITKNGQVDTYTYTAKNAGRIYVEVSEMYANTGMNLYVYNTKGETVESNYLAYGIRNPSVYFTLNAGEKVTIKLYQKSGHTSYKLTIGTPKKVTEIGSNTKINDSIEYEYQCNVYTFVPQIEGRYRIDLTGMKNGSGVNLYIIDTESGDTVESDYLAYGIRNPGFYAWLEKGATYKIEVYQKDDTCDYTINIGYQKKKVDISEYSEVKDSIEYTSQVNFYKFVPEIDGRYRFDITGMKSDASVNIYIIDAQSGDTVASDYLAYGIRNPGMTASGLVAGKEYTVEVYQGKGSCDYTLNIGHQKPTTNVKPNLVVQDSVEYTDQRNVYDFTADETGDIVLKVTGLTGGAKVQLMAWNELDETILNKVISNGGSVTIKGLKANEKLNIQVRQNSGLSDYNLIITD